MLVRPSKRSADGTESTITRRLGFLRPVTLVAMLLAMMATLIGPNDVSAAITLLKPTFSVNHGIITTANVKVKITSPSGGSIKYTINSTTPSASNGISLASGGEITLSKTTVLRAIAI